jgi:hypothetical protein
MLYKSLKFPASIYLDNIFVELCGVMSSSTALLKSIKKKSFEKKKDVGEKKRNKEAKQKFHVVEEEKRSKELLMDDILSISDSDIVGDRDKITQPVSSGLSEIKQLKSTASSSRKSNKRLKQVKSYTDLYKTGTITDLRRDKS